MSTEEEVSLTKKRARSDDVAEVSVEVNGESGNEGSVTKLAKVEDNRNSEEKKKDLEVSGNVVSSSNLIVPVEESKTKNDVSDVKDVSDVNDVNERDAVDPTDTSTKDVEEKFASRDPTTEDVKEDDFNGLGGKEESSLKGKHSSINDMISTNLSTETNEVSTETNSFSATLANCNASPSKSGPNPKLDPLADPKLDPSPDPKLILPIEAPTAIATNTTPTTNTTNNTTNITSSTSKPEPIPVASTNTTENASANVPLEESGNVSALYVGRVIGKGGEMIRDLQARSGCRIDVDQNVPEGAPRVITYRGTRRTIDFAKRLIQILCSENGKEADLPLGEASRKHLVVPANVIGKIIGRGGEMIRELQSKSQAKIQVDHTGAGGVDPSQRQVTVTGTEQSVIKAKEMIEFLTANPTMDAMQALAMLIEDKTRGESRWGQGPPYASMPNGGVGMDNNTYHHSHHNHSAYHQGNQGHPGHQGHSGNQGGYGNQSYHSNNYTPSNSGHNSGHNSNYSHQSSNHGYSNTNSYPPHHQQQQHYASNQPYAPHTSTESEIFPCSKMYMGRVIGQKGATINDVQKRSGCDIQINQDVPPGQDCEITIRGSRQGIESAKSILREIIELGPNHPYAGGRGAHSGGGGGGGNSSGDHHYGGYSSYTQGGYHQQQQQQQQQQQHQQHAQSNGYAGNHHPYQQQQQQQPQPTMHQVGQHPYNAHSQHNGAGYAGTTTHGYHQPQNDYATQTPHQQPHPQPQGYQSQPYGTQGQHPHPYTGGGGYGQQQQQHIRAPPPIHHVASQQSFWKSATAADGQTYYYNEKTGETQWDKPPGM